MTDAEVAAQVERADRFIEQLRELIAATVVDPASACADAQRRGLQRIADTLDAVPYVTMCNLANLNAALRGGVLRPDRVAAARGWWWPNAGLCRRGGVLGRVRAIDREGTQAAAAMRG